ncbi:MAG: hypothetical protein V4678_03700 [Patescibacteria group bacterium]
MPHRKNKKIDRTKLLLGISTAVLAVASICLGLALASATNADADTDSKTPINVNLGRMEYVIEGARATKRSNPSLESLRAHLTKLAKKDITLGCESSFYEVSQYTEDESQILLKYGCDYPSAPMYAVKTGNEWKTLSPTNQFSTTGIPLCGYVTQYDIRKEIAPVCYESGQDESSLRYFAR